jgi:hypothetical protein
MGCPYQPSCGEFVQQTLLETADKQHGSVKLKVFGHADKIITHTGNPLDSMQAA